MFDCLPVSSSIKTIGINMLCCVNSSKLNYSNKTLAVVTINIQK